MGVKFRKVSKTNICQSCGNPWSLGKYKLKIKKTFKPAKIQKVLKNSKNSKCKLSLFDKHILERYTECQSSITVQCGSCFKPTAFPTPLPPKEAKPVAVKQNQHPSNNQQKKKSKKGKPSRAPNPTLKLQKGGKNQEKQQVLSKQPSKVMKPATKQQFSKNQLKNITKNLKQNAAGKGSSLQSFLNSVK